MAIEDDYKDFVKALLSELDLDAQDHEEDAIHAEGTARAYHEGVARGLELARMKTRRLASHFWWRSHKREASARRR